MLHLHQQPTSHRQPIRRYTARTVQTVILLDFQGIHANPEIQANSTTPLTAADRLWPQALSLITLANYDLLYIYCFFDYRDGIKYAIGALMLHRHI